MMDYESSDWSQVPCGRSVIFDLTVSPKQRRSLADSDVNRSAGQDELTAYVAVWMNLMTAWTGLWRPKFRLTML